MGVFSRHLEGHPGLDTSISRHLMTPGGHQVPWFSFVVHLRSFDDLERWSTTATMSGADAEERRKHVLHGPPLLASTFRFRSNPLTGELIVIPRLPEDIIYGEGPRLVARAVQIAADRGSRVVGLGGLTAPATRAGTSLLPSLPRGVVLTNGNSFTAVAASANVLEACEFLGQPHPLVAVIGSTGSVGVAASQLLADHDLDLLLIGRSTERVRRVAPKKTNGIRFSDRLADVLDADVVLVLTSDKSARLRPEHFDGSRERVVIDVAQPSNVPVTSREAFRRRRALVVRGGWALVPGAISSHAHEAVMTDGDPTAQPGSAPACMAETYLFAADGLREHAVGAASPELARMLQRIAARRGVKVSPLALEPAASNIPK